MTTPRLRPPVQLAPKRRGAQRMYRPPRFRLVLAEQRTLACATVRVSHPREPRARIIARPAVPPTFWPYIVLPCVILFLERLFMTFRLRRIGLCTAVSFALGDIVPWLMPPGLLMPPPPPPPPAPWASAGAARSPSAAAIIIARFISKSFRC